MTQEQLLIKRKRVIMSPDFQKWYFKLIPIQLNRIQHRKLIEANASNTRHDHN